MFYRTPHFSIYCIMFLRFIPMVPCVRTSLLSVAGHYSIVGQTILFIHSTWAVATFWIFGECCCEHLCTSTSILQTRTLRLRDQANGARPPALPPCHPSQRLRWQVKDGMLVSGQGAGPRSQGSRIRVSAQLLPWGPQAAHVSLSLSFPKRQMMSLLRAVYRGGDKDGKHIISLYEALSKVTGAFIVGLRERER